MNPRKRRLIAALTGEVVLREDLGRDDEPGAVLGHLDGAIAPRAA